jgi:AcrR family transcriptional regulator
LSRITKDPEERKEEIIAAAQKLFEEKGYENTMMSDVAQSIGISQGLPYRYFKSKLELLDAVATKMGIEFIKTVVGFKFKPGMNAKDKLDAYFKLFEDIGSTKLVSTLHGNDNKEIHRRLSENTFKAVLPQLTDLIREGKQQKVFDCPHEEETAAFLIYGSMSVHDMVNERNIHEIMEIVKELFYRVLGIS